MERSRLSAVDFGRGLLETGDLDPLYLALNAAKLEPDVRARWCLAYWMFYHVGVASACAEASRPNTSKGFWATVWTAALEKWPRGTERRHFRAGIASSTIDFLMERYPRPEDAIGYALGEQMTTSLPQSYRDVMARAQTWHGFGPWISFKVADMVDAVLGVPVDFTGAEADLFEEPTAGAVIVLQQSEGSFTTTDHAKEIARGLTKSAKVSTVRRAMDLLRKSLGSMPVPHAPEQTVRLQELETILCKYKSHLNGHYEVGHDTREMLGALDPGRWGKLAWTIRQPLWDLAVKHGIIADEDLDGDLT